MPNIPTSQLSGIGDRPITEVVLGATGNPFTYVQGRGLILRLRNATAGALTPTINGSTAVAASDSGAQAVVAYNNGWVCQAIAPGAVRDVRLDSISKYLSGVTNIINGTGLVATVIDPSP